MYNAAMETIIRDVREIDIADRHVLEHVIGRELAENQKVIFQVVPASVVPTDPASGQTPCAPGQLPEWCNFLAGLSDEEADEVESVIRQRANLTRPNV
jgi:peroxiredoxin